MKSGCVLGIDTSNYKTSLAIVSGNEIICDLRRFLTVKQGERGLRQSEALFQHVQNMPEMFTELRRQYKGEVLAVAYSSRPRPVEGSYMPCFTAGRNAAFAAGQMLQVPVYEFSHQEGHIEAVRRTAGQKISDRFLACHFSGGTCEVLEVKDKVKADPVYEINCIGGTLDISFGQVLDRAGVAMGMEFPCGSMMDEMALNASSSTDLLTPVKVKNGKLNLSGIDTQIKNIIEQNSSESFIREIFDRLSDAMIKMLFQTAETSGINEIIMSGGVSSSRYIRKRIADFASEKDLNIVFDDHDLSSDNAVGTAFLGERFLWD